MECNQLEKESNQLQEGANKLGMECNQLEKESNQLQEGLTS